MFKIAPWGNLTLPPIETPPQGVVPPLGSSPTPLAPLRGEGGQIFNSRGSMVWLKQLNGQIYPLG